MRSAAGWGTIVTMDARAWVIIAACIPVSCHWVFSYSPGVDRVARDLDATATDLPLDRPPSESPVLRDAPAPPDGLTLDLGPTAEHGVKDGKALHDKHALDKKVVAKDTGPLMLDKGPVSPDTSVPPDKAVPSEKPFALDQPKKASDLLTSCTLSCPSDSFCELSSGCQLPGSCVKVPTNCDGTTGLPVCGCDGQPYVNDCVRQMAMASRHSFGACPF
jgi:hypothetical protein